MAGSDLQAVKNTHSEAVVIPNPHKSSTACMNNPCENYDKCSWKNSSQPVPVLLLDKI